MSEDFAIKNGVLTAYRGAGGAVVIPEGVTRIGRGTFSHCAKLTHVSLPEGLEEIGADAFFRCHNLTDIDLPQSVRTIEQ